MFEQRLDAVGERMDRRLMAGIEQQDRGRDEFIGRELLAFLFRRDQLRQEIVARLSPAPLDIVAHEAGEFERCRDGLRLDLRIAPRLIHRHHAMRPGQELRRHLARHAEQIGDDRHGDGCCKTFKKIGFARPGKFGDQ